MPNTEQTATDLYTLPAPGMGRFRILGSVEADFSESELNRLTTRLARALRFFPELNDVTVTVAKKPESHSWYAEADMNNDIIFLPTHELCPFQTICHELSHLAINKLDEQGVDVPPTSEEFTSILAIARLPPEHLDKSGIAYLGRPSVPRSEWPGICQRALEYREEKRNYIQKCKEWLKV